MERDDFPGHIVTPRERSRHTNTSSNRKRGRHKRTRSLVRSKSHHNITNDLTLNPELSVDNRAPGLLKIFGESVSAGTQYKSVLASTRSTAQELIKQALDRYGISNRLYKDFVLCESIGKTDSSSHCGEDKRKDKKGVLTPSSYTSVTNQHSLSKDSSSCVNINTPRSARSLQSRIVKKLLNDDKSPCGSPRAKCDSPRTPLGSPRTPCGSPSTSRGSPRTSVVYNGGRPLQHFDTSHVYHRNLPRFDRGGDDIIIQRITNNLELHSPRQHNNNNQNNSTISSSQLINDSQQSNSDWIPVYYRVLSHIDRPLELQEYWKPPEGLSRRYELRRRRDVMMDAIDNETTGLNDNARKIMISKVSPGVIPYSGTPEKSVGGVRTVLRDEWNRAAAALTNASLTYTEDNVDGTSTNIVEGDPRQAYICPSIYPYLLTLRGVSIQKDLVLYPLKSRTLSIGSAEKKIHTDDIQLSSNDVNPSHCRVTLKRLPQDDNSLDESKKIYWYCLELEIFGYSFVAVNGIQVRQKSTVFPGDLLGIGRQYLFLYKDPTGGHDIPSAVPWLPENETEASAIYSQVIRNHQEEYRDYSYGVPLQDGHSRARDAEELNLDMTPYQEEDSNVLDDSAVRDAAIFLAYHRDKEMELFECISEQQCHATGDYPLSQALLFLASHQYAARKFSGNHQTTFFKRLVRVVRARVGVVSKLMSQQKQESLVFNSRNATRTMSSSDHFPCLVNWLSTVLTLLGHIRTSQFQTYVGSLARRNDVIKSVQEAVGYFEETVSFLFQQIVYSVTKVLYDPINKFIQSATLSTSNSSNEALRRIVDVLQAVRQLAVDLLMKTEVANQLMVYLLFFVSTTLFNRIIAKGSKLYNRESGTILQEGVTALEGWAKDAGLESEFVGVSEHILSLVDLLSSSKRTLMRLDWNGFRTQYSPLSDIHLHKILGEYNLGDGVTSPESWHPPRPVDANKGDLTISLSSHPPFVLPKQGEQMSLLQDKFPAAFYRHLEQIQQRFSLVGEDAYYSGLSSAGNTPRLSNSIDQSANLDTFFSHDPNASLSGGSSHNASDHAKNSQIISKFETQPKNCDETDGSRSHKSRSNSFTKGAPPPMVAPKPKRTHVVVSQPDELAQNHRVTAPPPYNMAIKLKQKAQLQEIKIKPTESKDNHSNPFQAHHPVVLHHHSTADPHHEQKSKQNNIIQTNLQKFQTLPDNKKDQLFAWPSSARSKSSHSRSQRNHQQSRPHTLATQQSWTSGSQPVDTFQHNRTGRNDLMSTYPLPRERPSSAIESVKYPATTPSSSNSESFMNPSQREVLLTTRSNSALGYEQARDNGGIGYLQKQQSMPNQNTHVNGYRDQSQIGAVLHTQSYQHIGNSSPNINNRNSDIHTFNQHSSGNTVKNSEDLSNSFTHGTLRRSPRNPNLSQRTLSETRLNDAKSDKNRFTTSQKDSDIPPPLPPRGEKPSIKLSIELPNNTHYQKPTPSRESPIGSTFSNQQRQHSGSRTSVEIQDITENQYVIYNPDSPVKEFFDYNQNYLSMSNRNVGEIIHKPINVLNKDQNRKLTRVPPLDLPDDLLGTSENESQDEVFNNSSNREFANGQRSAPGSVNRSRKTSSVDDYPDDVYIDVNDVSASDSTNSSNLKVLPLSDESRRAISHDQDSRDVFIRYRHSMPDSRDITTKGEVTGEVFTITLVKNGNKLGMGLIDGLHTPLNQPGIYVRNVLPDTPAALCGCLRVGDRILSINDKSIVDIDYKSAMKLIHSTGPRLNLMVAKCDRSIASKISASTTGS